MNNGSYSKGTMRLLVVCTANVARSPLAATMLRATLAAPGVMITSAGTHARTVDQAADGAKSLAVARGLDLSTHRSQPVTADDVRDADLILTASEDHRDHCGSLATGAGSRTFTLREFARLLDATSTDQGPVTQVDRLLWLREQAHYARPRSPRPRSPEDIDDPITGGERVWRQLGESLDELVERVGRAAQPDD